MPLYEKIEDSFCENCAHFRRHYIWDGWRYAALRYGHCVYPRLKAREVGQSCPHWTGCEESRTPTAE